jgi:hypothetical protein
LAQAAVAVDMTVASQAALAVAPLVATETNVALTARPAAAAPAHKPVPEPGLRQVQVHPVGLVLVATATPASGAVVVAQATMVLVAHMVAAHAAAHLSRSPVLLILRLPT